MATPLVRIEFGNVREKLGRPPRQTLRYSCAGLIELVYSAKHAANLLNELDIAGEETRIAVTPCAGHGVGCVQASRGTQIHEYEADDSLVANENLIEKAPHSNAPTNMSLNEASKMLIKDGNYDREMHVKVNMPIRAGNP